MLQQPEFSDKKIRELLEENLEIAKANQQALAKIQRWILWQRILGVAKVLIIIIPIILGIIYLPSLLEKAFAPYKELLNLNEKDVFNEVKNQFRP